MTKANSQKDAELLLSSFIVAHYSYGIQSYVFKQKGPKCVILKLQNSFKKQTISGILRYLTLTCLSS